MRESFQSLLINPRTGNELLTNENEATAGIVWEVRGRDRQLPFSYPFA